jgi:hypothetical protein
MKTSLQKLLLLVLAYLVLFLPIIIYVYQFSFTLSTDHQRWAEFGSVMSGIYSPIIAFVALFVLIGQSKAQTSMNKHHYDQTYIQENRKDLDYYINKLENYLDQSYDEKSTIAQYLEAHYLNLSNDELLSESRLELANVFTKKHPKILNIWLAVNPILMGLSSQKEFPYEHNFTSSKLRITSSLTLSTCIAIDCFYFCITNDLQKKNYFFKN